MSVEDKLYKFLSIYKKMPDWMKRIVTMPFGALPREKYLGANYKAFYELAAQMDKSSPEEVEEFQYLRIMQILEDAYKYVPYYRERWTKLDIDIKSIKSVYDFEKTIPFVTREELQNMPLKFISEKYDRKNQLLVNSGGSTGIPLDLYYLKGYTRSAERAFWNYCFSLVGYSQGDRIARLRGDYIGKDKPYTFDPYRNTLILSSFSLNQYNAKNYIKALQRYKIEYITAYPASCMNLIGYFDDRKFEFPYMKAVMLGSENIYEFQISRIKEFFGIDKVFKGYGHGEATVAACNCYENDNYHFHPAYGAVEFLESEHLKDDNIVNLREIVGTSFINPLMPLIRYRSNDFGVELGANCSCGRSYKSLKEIIGREQEIAIGIKNEKVTLTALIFGRHLNYFSHINKMQIVNKKPGEIVVKIVPKSTFINKHHDEIISSLSEKEGMPFMTSVEIVSNIETTKRGKYKFLIREF
jgi:phenylacetate-CoA ligase